MLRRPGGRVDWLLATAICTLLVSLAAAKWPWRSPVASGAGGFGVSERALLESQLKSELRAIREFVDAVSVLKFELGDVFVLNSASEEGGESRFSEWKFDAPREFVRIRGNRVAVIFEAEAPDYYEAYRAAIEKDAAIRSLRRRESRLVYQQ